LGAEGNRSVNAKDGKLNALTRLCVPGDDHAVRSVESLDDRPAKLAEDAGHLAVHPDLGVVVDHNLKGYGRTCGAEVSDLLRYGDINAVPVKTHFGRRATLVKRVCVDGFPLGIIEVRRPCVGSVIVGLNGLAPTGSQVGAYRAGLGVHDLHIVV